MSMPLNVVTNPGDPKQRGQRYAICYPFDLCYSKCQFSTDRIKQADFQIVDIYNKLSRFLDNEICDIDNKISEKGGKEGKNALLMLLLTPSFMFSFMGKYYFD